MRAVAFGVLLTLLAVPASQAQAVLWTSGAFTYDGSGNVTFTGTDAYVYDSLSRLVTATADRQRTGAVNQQSYTYDPYGNRLTVTTSGTGCAGGCATSVLTDINNHVTNHGASYDAAGNLKTFDTFTYAYDGSGMLTRQSVPGGIDWQYIYTADDERVATYTGQGNWRFTLRDLDGKVLREVTAWQNAGATTWARVADHVYRDGLLLASVEAGGATEQFHLDHLGTPRMVTSASGAVVGIHTYYAFGDELALSANEFPLERLKFTGHERDLNTLNGNSLDYMHARYYSANMGRFLSVDPKLGVKDRPQSWNRYAYVHNNPLNAIDPDGEDEYFVFRATATSSDAKWLAIRREAVKHGNTVTIYNGQSASTANYINALATQDAHIVDAGHTVLVDDGHGGITAGSVEMASGSIGIAADTTLPVPVSNADVQADTVAIFGCSSIGLSGQYSATTAFTGVASGPDALSSIAALDKAAQAYTSVMAMGGSVDAATNAASAALKKSKDPHDTGDTAATVQSPPL